jgi:hypothetical protein
MRDLDIRQALHTTLLSRFHTDGSLVLNELGLCNGETRVDIAVINGQIHGYEIKSDKDTLERLPKQIELYGQVLDTATLVVGMTHLDHALEMLPSWWGVILAKDHRDIVTLEEVRPGAANPVVDPVALASFLWKQEALDILHGLGISGLGSKPRRILWARLADELDAPTLNCEVRKALKARGDWRVALRQKSNGDSRRPEPIPSSYLAPPADWRTR